MWGPGGGTLAEPRLPFAHLNLRRNPFGELPAEVRAELAVVDPALLAYLPRLARPGFVLQIRGERGHGKTTCLLALRRHVPAAPYLHLAEGAPAPDLPAVPLLLLDEAQRLPSRRQARLFDSARSFVLSTHADHGAGLARAGLSHATLWLESLTPARLQSIVARRIEWARRAAGPVPVVGPVACATLVARHGADVRAALGELYGVFQQLSEVGDVRL